MSARKAKTATAKPATPLMAMSSLPPWMLGGILVLATVLVYQPAWRAGFIWDDDIYVTTNPLLTAPDGLWRIWFSLDSPSQYFPLTYTIFRLQHAFWGQAAGGYHCFNIALHAINALLVWRLFLRLYLPGAWVAAAIFALHPVQVETVAWVTELKNVLSLFFFLLALLAWLEFIRQETKLDWKWYSLALLCQALALAAKSTACTLPAALLLILWLKHKPINRSRLIQVVPFLAMGIGMGLLAMWWERFHQGTQGKLFALSPLERSLVASHALWFYLGKLFWPADLTFSYPRWIINQADPWAYGWLALVAGAGAAVAFLRRFTGRSVEVAALFFALTLSPLLGFIMLYTFLFSFVADHYQYVACLGPIALTVAAMNWGLGLKASRWPLARPLIYGMLLLTLGILTWRQCRTYADAETLWRMTIDRNPSSWMARINLGNVLFDQGRNDEGMEQFKQALQCGPESPEAHNDLGYALLEQGQPVAAAELFEEAIRLHPDYAEAEMNLGIALLNQGRTGEAISQYQDVIRLNPDFAQAHYNLGVALLKKSQTDLAAAEFREAIRLRHDYPEACNDLGVALFKQGQTDEAIKQFQTALSFMPDYADAKRNLTTALQKKSDPKADANQPKQP